MSDKKFKAGIHFETCCENYYLGTNIEERPGCIDFSSEEPAEDQIKEVARACLQWLKDNKKIDITSYVHDNSFTGCFGMVSADLHTDKGEYIEIAEFERFFGLK